MLCVSVSFDLMVVHFDGFEITKLDRFPVSPLRRMIRGCFAPISLRSTTWLRLHSASVRRLCGLSPSRQFTAVLPRRL